jgi:hypothetical protein
MVSVSNRAFIAMGLLPLPRFQGKIADAKVAEAYDRLDRSERQQLTLAFRRWVARDTLGFTMLGLKPMALLEEEPQTGRAMKTWGKIKHLLNRNTFMMQYIPDWDWLYFANKPALKAKLTQHEGVFQERLAQQDVPKPVTAEAVLSSLETNEPINVGHLLNDEFQGIYYGFGATNARLYAQLMADMVNGDAMMVSDTVLLRHGPLETLSPKQFRDACKGMALFSQLPMWREKLVDAAHEDRVMAAIGAFMKRKPDSGVPKAAVFEVIDTVFHPNGRPTASRAKLNAATRSLYGQLEEYGGFSINRHQRLPKGVKADEICVSIPGFRACAADPEPKEMLAGARQLLKPMSRWVQSPTFFQTLLQSLFSDQPEHTLRTTLDRFED